MSHATRYGSIFLVVLLATTRGAVAQPSPIDLGTLGGKNSYAIAVNDRGHVVGESQTATNDIHAFFWSTTEGMVDLGTLGGWRSRPLAINNNDEVVGWSTTTAGGDRAFRSCGPTTAGWWTWVDERHPVGGGPQGRPCAATKSWIPSRRLHAPPPSGATCDCGLSEEVKATQPNLTLTEAGATVAQNSTVY